MGRPTDKKHTDVVDTRPERFLHKKSLGQNFLTSDIVPKWLVAAGDVTAGDKVLEIGPGTGALTRVLLTSGAIVIAVEADIRAIELLTVEFSAEIAKKTLILYHLDARTLDIAALGLISHQFKVIANIPYYLSGFLLRTFLENPIQPTTLVFLMQKEVVVRIARDAKESILSLSVKAFGQPKYIKTVTKGHFNPPPKIDSAILQITDITPDKFANSTEQAIFFKLLHLGFGQKRKQLISNLSHQYDRTELTKLFTDLGIALDARAETISLTLWLQLTKILSRIPIRTDILKNAIPVL